MSDGQYKTAREDLAKVIAQETSGMEGAIPESEDFDLADIFIKIINGDRRYEVSRSKFAELANELIDPKTF